MKTQALMADYKAAENFQLALMTHNETIPRLHSSQHIMHRALQDLLCLVIALTGRFQIQSIPSLCLECRASASVGIASS